MAVNTNKGIVRCGGLVAHGPLRKWEGVYGYRPLQIARGRLPVMVCFHYGNQQKVMKGGGSPMLQNEGMWGLAPTLLGKRSKMPTNVVGSEVDVSIYIHGV